jgi:hypothetical protein
MGQGELMQFFLYFMLKHRRCSARFVAFHDTGKMYTTNFFQTIIGITSRGYRIKSTSIIIIN